MPPKRRANTDKSAGSTKLDSKASATARRPKDVQDHPSTAHAQSLIPGSELASRPRESKVKWSPVFKRLGYFALILAIPAFLNYAVLNQELKALVPKGNSCILYY